MILKNKFDEHWWPLFSCLWTAIGGLALFSEGDDRGCSYVYVCRLAKERASNARIEDVPIEKQRGTAV